MTKKISELPSQAAPPGTAEIEINNSGTSERSPLSYVYDRANHTGSQPKLDDLSAPDDNTDLDATGSVHGLMPKADSTKLAAITANAIADIVEDTTPELGGDLDALGKNIDNIQNLIHDISTTTVALDFNNDEVQTIDITANTTFTTSNRAIGRTKVIKILNDGTIHTLAFPAWIFVGAKPTDIAASKTGILSVTNFGTTDAAIVASYAVEA